MLFLIVERIRGSDSEWAPWIGVLPQAFNTPLFFGKAEMDELKGTTLYSATRSSHQGHLPGNTRLLGGSLTRA